MTHLGAGFHGGALPSPPDHRDWPLAAQPYRALDPNRDLRQYQGQSLALPVRDQGQVGACTGFAWTALRAALTAKFHIDTGTVADLGDTISPRYLYDRERGLLGTYPQDSGADMRTGGQVLSDWGCPPEHDCPYTGRADNGPLGTELTPHMDAAAQFYRIGPSQGAWSGYYRLAGSGGQLLNSMFACLNDDLPFVIGFSVYPSFLQTGPAGRVPPKRAGDSEQGGHAICVFGSYADATFAGGGCLVAQNSWGLGWGQDGWCYLPWQYVRDGTIWEAWTAR